MSTGKEHAQMCLSAAGKATTGNMKQIVARLTNDGTHGQEATGSIDKKEGVDAVDKQTKKTSPEKKVSQKQTASDEASNKLKRKRAAEETATSLAKWITAQNEDQDFDSTKNSLLRGIVSHYEKTFATDVEATAPQVAETAASSGRSNQNGFTKADVLLSSPTQASEHSPSESVRPAAGVKTKAPKAKAPKTAATKINALLSSPTQLSEPPASMPALKPSAQGLNVEEAKPTAPQVRTKNAQAIFKWQLKSLLSSHKPSARNDEERLAILAAKYKDGLISLKFYEAAQAQILTPCPIAPNTNALLSSPAQASEHSPSESARPAAGVKAKPTGPQAPETVASNTNALLSSPAQASEQPSESVRPAASDKAKSTAPQVPKTASKERELLLSEPPPATGIKTTAGHVVDKLQNINIEARLAVLAGLYKDKFISENVYKTAQLQMLNPAASQILEISAFASAIAEWAKIRDQGFLSDDEFANVKAQIMEQVRNINNGKAAETAEKRAFSKEMLVSRLNVCFQDKIALIRGLMSDKVKTKNLKEDEVVPAFVAHIFADSTSSI